MYSNAYLESLYDQNHQKYISYLNEFSKLAEHAESEIFSDGATYVNHPLIQMTQVVFIALIIEF